MCHDYLSTKEGHYRKSYIVPKYLKNKPIDHSDVIASFKNFADHIIALLKDCEFAYISIGNEVDSYLVGDSRKWREFNELYKQAFHHIKAKYPHVPVGVKVTYDGMIGPSRRFVREINQETDLVLVTYYILTGPSLPSENRRRLKTYSMK